MKMEKIKNRGVLFTYKPNSEWDLNIYLILGKRYNYIVDTGLGSLSVVPVMEYIRHDSKPVVVINTHYHWDHIWGNCSFSEHTIISHNLCRGMIEENWKSMLEKNKQYCNGEVKICLPGLGFDKELYFLDDRIRVIYTPGHTIDSVSVIDEEEKVIHAGDNIGDTVDEIVPSFCDKDLYIDTLLKYRELDFDTFVSGHNIILGKGVIDKILNSL